ncbi:MULTISPECIES: hypothetical protein [Thiomicrorhabdus]|uniref:Uncharacterized protein n=1 Tax=Thiomicrorhabdus heinhorstiae TaxID=2748010 RepID=A0ABS0BW95_9GAMM|nr:MULTISPECIES: hypothetical protein [Thiomicrorhabdus]MBF6057081.1 hypothetical protein [Thiomicrorhabdus heinhorstiae]
MSRWLGFLLVAITLLGIFQSWPQADCDTEKSSLQPRATPWWWHIH